MKMLIMIDDEMTNLKVLGALAATTEKMEVIFFEEPLKAIAWCRTGSPDLVLVNNMMPEMNGDRFIQQFRQIGHCSEVPVMMVTPENTESVKQQVLKASTLALLAKPMMPGESQVYLKNLQTLQQVRMRLREQPGLLQDWINQATQSVLRRRNAPPRILH